MNSSKSTSVVQPDCSSLLNRSAMKKLEQLFGWLFCLKNSKPVIAVIRLSGVIGKVSNYRSGLCFEGVNEQIEKAFKIKGLSAVCLIINSPGGSPVQSELIATRIIKLAKEKETPVYSFVEDVAASGGYWLACAGDEIYASKSSIIGSIGVVSSGFGFHHALNKLGVERRIYAEGKNKSILDPFQPASEEDVKIIKNIQKQIHLNFIEYVKNRRGSRLSQTDEILFNGEFWAGRSATDFGLIDGINDMYSFIKQKFGEQVKIVYVASKQSWLKKKFGIANKNLTDDLVNNIVDCLEHRIINSKFNFE